MLTKKLSKNIVLFLIVIGQIVFSERGYAQIDKVVASRDGPHREDMMRYNMAVLRLALDLTAATYGPYSLTRYETPFSDTRALKELKKTGGKINVHVSITSEEREKSAFPIRIPVRRGLLNYRVIVTKRKNLPVFQNVSTLQDLKKVKTGGVKHWITTSLLELHGFDIAIGNKTERIFRMLNADRFIYILRGVNEVFGEQGYNGGDFEDLAIEPTIMVYLPLPYYTFVAPSEKRIISRLSEGLEKAASSGKLTELFMKHYGSSIEKADISKRKVFFLSNPRLANDPAMRRKSLWYFHDEEFAKHLAPSSMTSVAK